MPQWSPVMKTGNTGERAFGAGRAAVASMEPGHEDREYRPLGRPPPSHSLASMEPGHEDREYACRPPCCACVTRASMEPGHEDREYADPGSGRHRQRPPQWSPVMKTGNTWPCVAVECAVLPPQWSPVMKTGNTSTLTGLT